MPNSDLRYNQGIFTNIQNNLFLFLDKETNMFSESITNPRYSFFEKVWSGTLMDVLQIPKKKIIL